MFFSRRTCALSAAALAFADAPNTTKPVPSPTRRRASPSATYATPNAPRESASRKRGAVFAWRQEPQTQSNRIFVTVECLYGYKQAIADGIKRILKP